MDEEKSKLIDKVARAFRQIGQPETAGLIFVCDSESEFAQFKKIINIPVFKVPGFDVRGGLLLAGRQKGWTKLNQQLLKFQQEMEI